MSEDKNSKKQVLDYEFDDISTLDDSTFDIGVAAFGFFYAIVYKITSNSYYTIVSGRKE